jgi:hypothetical protein
MFFGSILPVGKCPIANLADQGPLEASAIGYSIKAGASVVWRENPGRVAKVLPLIPENPYCAVANCGCARRRNAGYFSSLSREC